MTLLIGSAVCAVLGFVVDKIHDQIPKWYGWMDSLASMMIFGGISVFVMTVIVGFLPSIVDFIGVQFNQLWSL